MKLIIITLTLLLSFNSLADAWDNMTYSEAEKVVTELKQNPFIFDYCDCCDYDGEYATTIEFLKVTHTEIVECNWNPEMYSVKVTSELISTIQFSAKGPVIDKMTVQNDNNYSSTLFMNYTWGLNKETKKATPFFNIIPYDYYGDENKPCLYEFEYPTPRQLKKTKKIQGYKKWWKSNIR